MHALLNAIFVSDGDRSLLKSLGIDVKLELPSIGENLAGMFN